MKHYLSWVLAGVVATAVAQTPPAPATSPAGSPAPPSTAPASPYQVTVTPVDPNAVVITVGDEKITRGEYDAMLMALPQQYQAAARGPQRRAFAERLVQVKVLSKEAQKRGIDQQPTVKQQLAFDRENVLAGALYQDFMKNAKVDDAELRKYYDAHKSEFETAKARHILIRFKGSPVQLRPNQKELSDEEALAKAQDLRKKLQVGGDFAALAKAESDDVGSGANGGDLGTFKHGQMVGAFDQAAFSLPIGQVSEPIKTQFGYHIIQVQERQAKPLDQAKTEIVEKLAPEAAKKQADDLRSKAAVTFDDKFFGPAPPPSAQ